MSPSRSISPSSSLLTSAVICSGTLPGRHSTSTSRRWCSITPPVRTPGASPVSWISMDILTFSSRRTSRKSMCTYRPCRWSRWISRGMARCFLPSTSRSTTVADPWVAWKKCRSSWLESEIDTGSSPCPYNTPGTRPSARSLRAAPLPRPSRAVAFRTVSMVDEPRLAGEPADGTGTPPRTPSRPAALPSGGAARLGCSMVAESSALDGRTVVEPDGGTMAELYTRYVPGGIRLAYLLTGDRHQAEDLAHEAFIRCVGRFQHLRAHTAFDAYLRRAIVNLHTSGLRRHKTEREWLRREGPRHAAAVITQRDVGEREDLWRARYRRSLRGSEPRWCSAITRTCQNAMPPRRSVAASRP